MTINVPLLRKALKHVTARPEEWDQSTWAFRTSCGTVYCLAGHIATMAGWKPEWNSLWEARVFTKDGARRFAPDVAAEALGVDERTSLVNVENNEYLFAAGNSLDDLWRIASKLTDGEIEVPEDLPEL
ncbi:hypothetical protein GCM10012275_28780 [Longimycelium tulufanense]|uniref:Uncharacterized protein n=1 Tax=Longimycelium tulufanense TaxID=907463 RepID=A0A8J3FWT5_9PSEU|nr:hypothetical protein [Longimycelium tulufanense]GGM55882.1 hypothetical protein GCM10012275_28780 [Longimycelium tulufanense]